ncbi:MAG: peptidylprolyl isomerase [Pleurocapsa sp.]
MTQEQLAVNPLPKAETISLADIVRHLKLSQQMPSVMTGLINQKIIEQTVAQENLPVAEQELQVAADRFRFEHNLLSSQATLNWLEKHHLSVTEFEELIEGTLLAQKLAEHLFKDRVEAYFYSHQLDYDQAVIYEIVLSDFDLAMELFYGIQEQELSFWDLAHQYIQDTELRRRGGYRGQKSRKQLQPEIAAAVFSTANSIPQLLKPIAIGNKTHLVYVEEIIQPTLDLSLSQTIVKQLFENWLSQQREQAIDNLS